MDRPDAPVATFERLRADLRRGDFGGLAVHLADLSSLGQAIESGVLVPDDPVALRAEAERASEVLSAAASGLRAVLRRLGEAGAPATVYSADGSRTALQPPRPSREGHA